MAPLRDLRRDTGGLSTVEYILILVIVAITALLLWQSFGSSVNSRVDQATQSVAHMDGRGGGGAVATGDSAGSATAMAITEGRQGGPESEGGMGMGMGAAGSAGGEGGEGGGRARPAGEAEGAGAGFGDTEAGGETAELVDDGPDLFLWIGWLLVLILGAVTLFSVLGKRIGKSK